MLVGCARLDTNLAWRGYLRLPDTKLGKNHNVSCITFFNMHAVVHFSRATYVFYGKAKIFSSSTISSSNLVKHVVYSIADFHPISNLSAYHKILPKYSTSFDLMKGSPMLQADVGLA